MMFYSCYQGCIHPRVIVFLCGPPEQVCLGEIRLEGGRGAAGPIGSILLVSSRIRHVPGWEGLALALATDDSSACQQEQSSMP